MSYMASIYGIMRYELWELIQMQMTEGQGHLVQQSLGSKYSGFEAQISVFGSTDLVLVGPHMSVYSHSYRCICCNIQVLLAFEAAHISYYLWREQGGTGIGKKTPRSILDVN